MKSIIQVPTSPLGLELEYPRRLVAFPAWAGHIPFAFWLVEKLQPKIFIELGVHTGNSYCAFLQAVQALRLDTRCFGIDHWKGDAHAGQYDSDIYQELSAYHDPLYGGFSTLISCEFEHALSHFSDASVDLLHIDGLHTYEAVKRDFASWLSKMSSRAIMLFHDINVRERDFGVWQFWEETAPNYPNFDFFHSHGLGVLYVGNQQLSGPLQRLFESGEQGRNCIRRYFERLGSSIAERYLLKQREEEYQAKSYECSQAMEQMKNAFQKNLERARNDFQYELTASVERARNDFQHELTASVERARNEFTASTSWRLTAPFRLVANYIKRAWRKAPGSLES